MSKDGLGDRCKGYENAEGNRRAMRGLPLLARLDGRAFHTFTRDLRRPYEPGMSTGMIETTRYLVQEMNALVGYTQSDDGKHSGQKQEMLFQKGVNWNDYPSFFKRGRYLQRRTYERGLSEAERARIPEAHRPPIGTTFQRTQVVELELPPARRVTNLVAVLFERADPQTST